MSAATILLTLPEEMVYAIAWATMIAAPGRPINILPYLYDGGSKRPAVRDWAQWHGGTTDDAATAGRARRQPVSLWNDWGRYAARRGIRAWATLPGALGVVVVDVDAPHLLGRVLDTYGETEVYVTTPRGGYHLYYRAPPTPPVTRTAVIGPGTYDVKSIGGTVHAPGSLHPSGRCYAACAPGLDDTPLIVGRAPALPRGSLFETMPDFPAAVFEAEWAKHHAQVDDLPADGEPVYVETDDEVDALRAYMQAAGPAVSGGGGHEHTFKLLRKIGDLGCPEDVALELAREWNETCEPPWTDLEIRTKVRDAYRVRKSPVGWRIADLQVSAAGAHEDGVEDSVDYASALQMLREMSLT